MKKSNLGFLVVKDFYLKTQDTLCFEESIISNIKSHYGVRGRCLTSEFIPDSLAAIREHTVHLKTFCDSLSSATAYLLIGVTNQPAWLLSDENFIHRYIHSMAIEMSAIGFNVVFCLPSIETSSMPIAQQNRLKTLRKYIVGSSIGLSYETLKITLNAPDYWLDHADDTVASVAATIAEHMEAIDNQTNRLTYSTIDENNGNSISRTFIFRE